MEPTALQVKALAWVLAWIGANGTTTQTWAVALHRSGPEFASSAKLFRRVTQELDTRNWGQPMQPEIPGVG